MRQTNNSDYTFKVANRAYFDSTVNLTGCVGDILTNELQVVDFTKVSLCFFFVFGFVFRFLFVCFSSRGFFNCAFFDLFGVLFFFSVISSCWFC